METFALERGDINSQIDQFRHVLLSKYFREDVKAIHNRLSATIM